MEQTLEFKWKKFLCFVFNYSPSGGVNDLKNSFDTEEEAIEFMKNEYKSYGDEIPWSHIVDRDTGKILHIMKDILKYPILE